MRAIQYLLGLLLATIVCGGLSTYLFLVTVGIL